MVAARVSRTIVSVEVDVPSKESGEIVQALAKQVVAYCLRNMVTIPVLANALLITDQITGIWANGRRG